MNIIEMILDLFFRKIVIITPKEMPSITSTEVGAMLKAYTPNVWLSDGTFGLVDTENLKAFLASDPINGRAYVSEKHDCDDFSHELMGHVSDWNPDNTFGIVWGLNSNGGAHAWNFFVNENIEVKYVEPQTDSIFDPSNEKIWLMIV